MPFSLFGFVITWSLCGHAKIFSIPLDELVILFDNACYSTVLTAKKFAEIQPKEKTPSKKEKGGKEAGKQQPQQQEKKEKKKEEKKAAPPAEEMDECEAALASEPKTKDPFAHLSKRY